VATEVEVLLDVTRSRLVNIYQRFGVPCCLHFWIYQTKWNALYLNCGNDTETSTTSPVDVT